MPFLDRQCHPVAGHTSAMRSCGEVTLGNGCGRVNLAAAINTQDIGLALLWDILIVELMMGYTEG